MKDISKAFWCGTNPDKCQLCSAPITDRFYDSRIIGLSQWAIMCPLCFRQEGSGLGTGKGQGYQLVGKDSSDPELRNVAKPDYEGRFVKIEG